MTSDVLMCLIICIFSIAIHTVSLRSHKHWNDDKHGDGNSWSCSKCGMSHPSVDARIINGEKVDPINKYPWMVGVKEGDNTFCAGAILNEWYVLTAAHCFLNTKPEKLKVTFLTEEDSKVPASSPVEKLIRHPKYNGSLAHYDIGLIKLQKPIVCNEFAAPICLPPPDLKLEPVRQSVYRIAGWGRTNGLKGTKDLLEGRIRIVDWNECSVFDEIPVTRSTSYCCKAAEDTVPCMGDSGGSMFKRYGSRFFSLGIASTGGSRTCELDAPIVYISVSKHMDWIQGETGVASTKILPNQLPPSHSRKRRRKHKSKHRSM